MKDHLNYGAGLFLTVIVMMNFAPAPVHAKDDNLLQNVVLDSPVLDLSSKNSISISWTQAHESTVDALICNIDGRVVRTLLENVQHAAGNHQVQWNGLDDAGELCPDNAYIPIIKIRTGLHGNALHNPSFSPWGERVDPVDLKYDDSQQKITYQLEKQALCLIRVGEKEGGPVYKTVLNWEPRQAGVHEEPWDGMDINGIVNAAEKEKFDILLDAFALPEGSILIKGSDTRNYRFNKIEKQFPLHPPHGNNTFLHVFHQRDVSHDISIKARLIKHGGANSRTPVIKGTTPFEVFVDGNIDIDHLKNEKFEFYLFVDGKIVFETPANDIPAILEFDTHKYPNGEHIVTINLRTTEDRVGSYSLKVNIKN